MILSIAINSLLKLIWFYIISRILHKCVDAVLNFKEDPKFKEEMDMAMASTSTEGTTIPEVLKEEYPDYSAVGLNMQVMNINQQTCYYYWNCNLLHTVYMSSMETRQGARTPYVCTRNVNIRGRWQRHWTSCLHVFVPAAFTFI